MVKSNKAQNNPSFEDLGYYFIRVGGFYVQNGVIMDNESRKPVMYPSYKGPQYIAYPPQNSVSAINMISLDVMRNTKVVEFLYNFWCSKQPYTNEKLIKFSNLYRTEATANSFPKSYVSACVCNSDGSGESWMITTEKMNNDALAFASIMTQVEELDEEELVELNKKYDNYVLEAPVYGKF